MEELQENFTLQQPIATPDQALFDRVWGRVMESPAIPPEEPSPALVPSMPTPPRQSPTVEELPCLGPSSLSFAPFLLERMEDSRQLRAAYLALGRRTQGMVARQLRALAEGHANQLRQLEAVHFLLTGETILSAPRRVSPPEPLRPALRELFYLEQRQRQQVLAAADRTQDPCLTSLFQKLAQQSQLRMEAIRRILEGQ